MAQISITKHLKLPLRFDEKKLLYDLDLILSEEWKPHFNKRGYTGDWKSIPLYAPNGDHNNIFAAQAEKSPILETILMKDCQYFKEVLSHFHCPLLSVRLLNLGVGAYIKPHKDHELGYENGCFRLHIPITTNKEVEFILDGNRLTMLPGECWYTNVNYTHSVANRGASDRVHLVIDGQRNDWSDELFLSLASRESLLTAEVINTNDELSIKRTIEELEKMKVPGYQKIIEDYRQRMGISEYSMPIHLCSTKLLKQQKVQNTKI